MFHKYFRDPFPIVMGLFMDILKLPWILITGIVPLFFGIFLLIKAIASDLSAASTNVDPVEGEVLSNGRRKNYKLPPIVLVHGVLGFGEGVCDQVLVILLPFHYQES